MCHFMQISFHSSISHLELSSYASFDDKTGEATVNVIAIKASVHLPFDHRLQVQNLSTQVILGVLEFYCMVYYA